MTTEDEKQPRRPRALMQEMPLYPSEAQIARAVLGDRAKDWKRIVSLLEAKYKFPPIIHLMGGRFWPAVVTFFYGWHSISLDNSRVDHSNHVVRNPRIWVMPPNTQFEEIEDEPPPLKTRTIEEGDAQIRAERVWPSERKYLGLFYQAKDDLQPSRIKGAGDEVPRRLKARGFIKRVGGSDFFPIWRITPEGEAAWLAIMSDAAKD
jgi:hypothetical protein